jgi:hippurate hydrolase
MQIPHLINLLHSEMTAWRQDLHAHPELRFEEHRTSDVVAGKLAEFGCEVHRNIGKTGVVGVLRTGNGPSIGLRADMDALPIHEANDVPYRSMHDGIMHACDRDGHTTMLLGAARYLAETRNFAGTVHFIFQPTDEARRSCLKMACSSASHVTVSSACTIGPTCRLESSLFALVR